MAVMTNNDELLYYSGSTPKSGAGIQYTAGNALRSATAPQLKTMAATLPTAKAPSSGGFSSAVSNNKAAAGNLGTIAQFNAKSTKDQLARSFENYALSDKQNKQLAELEKKQNSGKAAGERFAQAKKLQGTAASVLGASGNGMQGSGLGNLISMLRTRTDLDTGDVLGILTQNQNATNNALNEALNANILARNDAAATAEFGLRGIEADTAAQLNNIDSKLFVKPGTGAANVGSSGVAKRNTRPANVATSAGYILPPAASRKKTAPASSSYFDKLLAQSS
jgi:hypothetical protein